LLLKLSVLLNDFEKPVNEIRELKPGVAVHILLLHSSTKAKDVEGHLLTFFVWLKETVRR
jgi:hypothetical protein